MARAVVIPIAGTAGGNEHLLELKNPTGLKAKMDQIVVGHHLVLEIPEGEIPEDAAVDPFERRTEPLNARPELKRPKSAEQLFCLKDRSLLATLPRSLTRNQWLSLSF